MKKVLLPALIAFFIQSVFARQATQPKLTPTPPPSPQQQQQRQQQQPFDLSGYGVRIEPDRRLIVVTAALEAAGLETPLSKDGEVFRARLKNDLQPLNDDTRQKLQTFITQYKRRHQKETPAEIAAPFVSLAYALTPVPELQDPLRSVDLPADLLEVFDFAPLVREFYRRSTINANLEDYVKEYQKAGNE